MATYYADDGSTVISADGQKSVNYNGKTYSATAPTASGNPQNVEKKNTQTNANVQNNPTTQNTQTASVPQSADYTIGTEKGNAIYNSLGKNAGDTAKMTDTVTLERQADGSVVARDSSNTNYAGKVVNNYVPQNSVIAKAPLAEQQQFAANSYNWQNANESQRAELNAANKYLANKYGMVYDDATGTYKSATANTNTNMAERYVAKDKNGNGYIVASEKALAFARGELGNYLGPEDTSDGSTWYRGKDGTVTIRTPEGNEYTMAAITNKGTTATILTPDEYLDKMNPYIQDAINAALKKNQAGVELSVKEIEATLENTLPAYSKQAAEEYLKMLQAQRTSALRSAYNGDLGGIGQKQYDDVTAQYDAALLQIELEKQAFINSCNQQIDQLRAEGRLQDAQILSEWAQQKVDYYNAYYKTYYDASQTQEQIDLDKQNTAWTQNYNDRQLAFEEGLQKLELGFTLTADDISAMGIDPTEAQNYANDINEARKLSIDTAKAELAAVKASASGGSGGSGGGGGGSTPTANTGEEGSNEPANVGDGKATYNNGSQSYSVTVTKDGLLINDANNDTLEPAEGASLTDADGNKYYYTAKNGWVDSNTYKTQKVSEWFTKYNGSGSGTQASNATNLIEALERRREYASENYQEAVTEEQNAKTRKQYSGTARNGYTYTAPSDIDKQIEDAAARKEQYDSEIKKYDKIIKEYYSAISY